MKYAHIILLSALVTLAGCRKDEEPRPAFPMTYQETVTVQPGIGQFVVHHFYMRNISSRYQQFLSENGKTDADIGRILLSRAVLQGTYFDANFDFIQEVSLRIFDESNPNDWLEIAYRLPVPIDPGNNLPLLPNELDVKRFFQNPRFSIDLVLTLRRTTTEETPTRVEMEFLAEFN